MGKGMPMETGSCPKGGLAGAQADFSPPLTPPTGETVAPLVHSRSPDSGLSQIPSNNRDVGQGLFIFSFPI